MCGTMHPMSENPRFRAAAIGGTITAMTDDEPDDEPDRAAQLARELRDIEKEWARRWAAKRDELIREVRREERRRIPKTAISERTGISTKTLLKWKRAMDGPGKAPTTSPTPPELRLPRDLGRDPPAHAGALIPQLT